MYLVGHLFEPLVEMKSRSLVGRTKFGNHNGLVVGVCLAYQFLEQLGIGRLKNFVRNPAVEFGTEFVFDGGHLAIC